MGSGVFMPHELDFSTITLQDTLDLTVLMEEESKERYLELAEQIGSSHTDDATGFFIYMAQNEEKHSRELTEQRMKLFGTKESTVDKILLAEMQYAEAPFYDEIRSFMSLRKALDIALGSEKKSYDFYNKAMVQIKNEDVKKLLTNIRDEEIQHQKLITELMSKSGEDLNPEIGPEDVDTPEQ